MATAGQLDKRVTLDTPISEDQAAVVYRPSVVWAAIRPAPPGTNDESKTTHIVEMRYHQQVSFNTRLTYVDRHRATHELFVKGIQNVDMTNDEMVLLCEEVMTP